jgi:hypothetical protein
MNDREATRDHHPQLDEDDRTHIIQVFFEEMEPKLKKLEARLGTLNCDFAGAQYRNWSMVFKSVGSGFEVVDFEYDEDGAGMDLDL